LKELRRLNKNLQQALHEIKTLIGILPICSHCNEIRDQKGNWVHLEQHIEEHSEAECSHSICDNCLDNYYPEED